MRWLKKNTSEIEKISEQTKLILENNKELLKTVNSIKKTEVLMNQRLERIERLLEMGSYGVTREKRDIQLVVSFTSYGSRIYTVPLMLERLMNQTLKPDRIVLYLSKENFPLMEKELPERLLEMCSFGLEIRWCEGDLKSYKKLLPALKDFPEDIIITVDDDLYYELDMIEKLYDSYKKYPAAISARRTHRMTYSEDNQILPYCEWEKEYSECNPEPHMDLLATTGAGTLFPPHILPEEVHNEEYITQLCPTADDVWVKVMSLLRQVPVVPPEKKVKLNYIKGTQELSLWSINKEANDQQIKNAFEKYLK